MTASWITSAAIVALIIATIVFPWQRRIEHKFLLKKEKRELFRAFLSQSRTLLPDLKRDDLVNADSLTKLDALIFEIHLVAGPEVKKLCSEFLIRIVSFNGTTPRDETTVEEWQDFYGECGLMQHKILKAMNKELDRTAGMLPEQFYIHVDKLRSKTK